MEPRRATCHPDRPVHARNKCEACYLTWWRASRATRPPRHRVSRAEREQETGGHIGLGVGPPRRVAGVTQRVVNTIPKACPKCGATPLRQSGWYFSCLICGDDVYLVAP